MLSLIFLSAFTLFLVLFAITNIVHIFFLVPYVPTKNRVVEKMIKAAHLKPKETVFDLGCGDGRLLLAAEQKAGVKTVGFEIAPLMYLLAHVRKFFSNSKMHIYFQSLFRANLKSANVIFCYLLPQVMPRLAEKIKKECRRGTRIVSNTFHIPGLKLAKKFAKDAAKGLPTIYVYKV